MRESRKLDVPQLQMVYKQPNLREEFTYYFQVSNESNVKRDNASNTSGARLEYRQRNQITDFLGGFLIAYSIILVKYVNYVTRDCFHIPLHSHSTNYTAAQLYTV
jgi:hypothetical protein